MLMVWRPEAKGLEKIAEARPAGDDLDKRQEAGWEVLEQPASGEADITANCP